jgi:hypothetical protein
VGRSLSTVAQQLQLLCLAEGHLVPNSSIASLLASSIRDEQRYYFNLVFYLVCSSFSVIKDIVLYPYHVDVFSRLPVPVFYTVD